jgi:SAM-dependent methyltransferase
MLDDTDKQKIINAYEKRLAAHGFDVATLKSGGAGKQYVRHTVHADAFTLQGRRILDVGCGIGMFYKFLHARNEQFSSYTGIDIVDAFLEFDRKMYPEASFLKLDIFSEPLTHLRPDVVFVSQVFNAKYRKSDNFQVACDAIRRLFEAAADGIAVDFMSTYVDFREDEHFYFKPEALLEFGKSLTRYVTIQHDYLPFEFTLILRKQPRVVLVDSSEVSVYG